MLTAGALLVGVWPFARAATTARAGERSAAQPISFGREIEPILRERCWRCHARPNREGGLLLTGPTESQLPSDSGAVAIVPGRPEASELLARITAQDAERRMPPDGAPLSARQVATLGTWIAQGARWPTSRTAQHWAYVAADRPRLPDVGRTDWARNPIDYFVLARLQQCGLQPSPAAPRERLLRRVCLDLTGLPPTPEQRLQFLQDRRSDAYERLVDRLLASPAYGEKWARYWLDLARFSDSNGYQADQLREMWAYRDWVIAAWNSDMPYAQFTVEQLAGDLLAEATVAQRIATGFHRATTCNVEAGVDPEANRVDQVVDRVNTTSTVWLGTTLACAQCHNHKYDPFSQRDYYQFFAFFNNTPLEVRKVGGEDGVQFDFWGPLIELPMHASRQRRRADLQRQLMALRDESSLAASGEGKSSGQRIKQLQGELDSLAPPTTLVMVEQEALRETYVMRRGDYRSAGERVEAGTPSTLPAFPADLPRNRLGLARWLTDANHPLTWRVAVNHWWQEFFGAGLVRTAEDFGSQGEPPSHPELLDYLAWRLAHEARSIKPIHRLIVTSATYRQDSRITAELRERDPENRLLARGPRLRLSAESIRDNALAISGLLDCTMGGPPVYPPQPAGLWKQTGRNEPVYHVDSGANRYRRGIYVVWRRAAPYPSFVNFDGPDRMSCVVRRSRTNTPLQALTLLNDEAYVEMARALTTRILTEAASESLTGKIDHAFRLCLARDPTDQERHEIVAWYQDEWEELGDQPEQIDQVTRDAVLPRSCQSAAMRRDWAAWFTIANGLLNLDETITRE